MNTDDTNKATQPVGLGAMAGSLTLLQECHFILKAVQVEIRTNAGKPARKLLKEETWQRQKAQWREEREAAQKQQLAVVLAKLKAKENVPDQATARDTHG